MSRDRTFLGYTFANQPGSVAALLMEGVVPDLEKIGPASAWTSAGGLSEFWAEDHAHQLRPRAEVRAVPAASRIDRRDELPWTLPPHLVMTDAAFARSRLATGETATSLV